MNKKKAAIRMRYKVNLKKPTKDMLSGYPDSQAAGRRVRRKKKPWITSRMPSRPTSEPLKSYAIFLPAVKHSS